MSAQPPDIEGFRKLQEVLVKAADDPAEREKLEKDPKTVLREAGLHVPDDHEVKIVHNTSTTVHLVVPSKGHRWEELDTKETNVHTLCEVGF